MKLLFQYYHFTFLFGCLFLMLNACEQTAVSNTENESEFFCGTESLEDNLSDSLKIIYNVGKTLFKSNCASCHNMNMKSDATAPALGGTEERWKNYPKEDLYKFIQNSTLMITNEHQQALKIWKDWKPSAMPSFPDLTDEDVRSILIFINTRYEAK